MIGARIKCDQCGFIGEMEMVEASKGMVTAPSGWALVHATIRIKGELSLKPDQRVELRKRIREKTPPFHICPRCVFGAFEMRVDRLLGGPSHG